jgi:hypothetical protein
MMGNLKRNLLAATMMFIVSAGVFGQGNDNKRPPKNDPPKVHVPDKGKPPANNDKGNKKDDKKGKP